MKKVLLSLMMLLCAAAPAMASTAGDVRAGVKQYRRGNYEKSLSRFRQAQISSPDNPVVHFNIGDASYKTSNLDEAALGYGKVLGAKDKKLRGMAYYNLGNTAYRKGDTAQALDYYKKALDVDPGDQDAKYNIEYILLQQKNQKQQNKNQQKDNKNKDHKDTKDKQNGKGQNEQDKQAAEAKKKGMSKEDAERILQVFNEHDQDSARRRKMATPQIPKTDQDW